MYVDGNPMRFVDSEGNEPNEGQFKESISSLYFYFFAYKKPKSMKEYSAPWYNYAGDGNTDRISNFYTVNEKNRNSLYFEAVLLHKPINPNIEIQDALLYTYIFAKYVGPHLRPNPVSYMDWVSQKHDDEAPNPLNHFGNKKDSRLQTRASFNFVWRSTEGLYTRKVKTLEDLGVYFIGTQLYLNYGMIRGLHYWGQEVSTQIGKGFNCKSCNFFGR